VILHLFISSRVGLSAHILQITHLNSRFASRKEPKNCGEDHSTDDGNNNGVNQSPLARKTHGSHQETAEHGSGDSNYDVHQHTIPSTLHNLAGRPTGNQSHNRPP
jgi:hypothetical protein